MSNPKKFMFNEENSMPSILLNNGNGVMKYRAGQARNRLGQFASEGGGGGGDSAANMIEPKEVGSYGMSRTYVKQGLGNPSATTRENLMNGIDDGKTLIQHQQKTKGGSFDYKDEPVIPRIDRAAPAPAKDFNVARENIMRMQADTFHSAGMLSGMADNDTNILGNDYLDDARTSLSVAVGILASYGMPSLKGSGNNKTILGDAIIQIGNARDVFENENYHQYAESASNLADSLKQLSEFLP